MKPPLESAAMISSALGRVVGVPSAYLQMSPIAQPIEIETPTPASAIPELMTAIVTSEPITRMLRTFHGRLPMSRATVMKAMRPPRIGAVAVPPGPADPARAASSRGESRLEMTFVAIVSTTIVTRSATSASKSCRSRRRTTSAIDAAIGRPSVPMPPMMFNARTMRLGSSWAPVDRSVPSPAAVLVANQATRTMPAVSRMATTKRARSSGRRTRLGNEAEPGIAIGTASRDEAAASSPEALSREVTCASCQTGLVVM